MSQPDAEMRGFGTRLGLGRIEPGGRVQQDVALRESTSGRDRGRAVRQVAL